MIKCADKQLSSYSGWKALQGLLVLDCTKTTLRTSKKCPQQQETCALSISVPEDRMEDLTGSGAQRGWTVRPQAASTRSAWASLAPAPPASHMLAPPCVQPRNCRIHTQWPAGDLNNVISHYIMQQHNILLHPPSAADSSHYKVYTPAKDLARHPCSKHKRQIAAGFCSFVSATAVTAYHARECGWCPTARGVWQAP